MKKGIRMVKMKVRKKERLGKDFWWVVLVSEDEFSFRAGEYVSVKVSDKGERRDYSIAGREGKEELALLVDSGPGGVGSRFFDQLEVDEEVDLLGPLGGFVVDERDERLVMIATGSGIAPIKLMIEEELGKGKEIWLVWGMRWEEDIFWRKMFGGWQKKFSNFHFELVLSREKIEGVKQGHVQDVLSEKINRWRGAGFYVCGSGEMVKDVSGWLERNGVESDLVRKEKF